MTRKQEMIDRAAGGLIHVHVTDREGFFIVQHAIGGAFQVEGHAEAAALTALFEDLDLMGTYNALISQVQMDLRDVARVDKFDVYALSPASVEFFLGKFTAGRMAPGIALQLSGLIKRLKDAKLGLYVAPDAPPHETLWTEA